MGLNGAYSRLPIWGSGSTLVSINVVTLRQARLVPGWVTVFGREYGAVSTQRKLGD